MIHYTAPWSEILIEKDTFRAVMISRVLYYLKAIARSNMRSRAPEKFMYKPKYLQLR